MNKIAFIYGDTVLYWNSIIAALAVLAGILFYLAVYGKKYGSIAKGINTCPTAILLSLILSRIIHWYFRTDSYDGLLQAMTDFSGGGFALCGTFFGCSLAAWLCSRKENAARFWGMLDCMSIGGCAAISLGRLSCFFTAENRGDILNGITHLPLVSPILNPTSGIPEYRFATFLFQSIICGCIFAVLMLLFLSRKKKQDGDITFLFLLLYCATQVVMDSTRYDALRLRSNGFISVVQVLSAAALLTVLILFTVRLVKKTGWQARYCLIWLAAAAGFGGAGYMEYHVQRHGNQAVFAYSMMSLCLCVIVVLGFLLWNLSCREYQNPKKSLVKIWEINTTENM